MKKYKKHSNERRFLYKLRHFSFLQRCNNQQNFNIHGTNQPHRVRKIHADFIATISICAVTVLSGLLLSINKNTSGIDASVTVNVVEGCKLTGANNSISATVYPGTPQTVSGSSITADCSGADGWAIYAVGYSDDIEGNTKLINTTDDSYMVSTGTSGSSFWSMALSAGSGATTSMLSSDLQSGNIAVPNLQTKVATISTDATTSATFSPSYMISLSANQANGTYEGAVKYTIVKPSTDCPDGYSITGGVCEKSYDSIDDLIYMQEFANLDTEQYTTVLASMTTDNQYVLRDSRDNKQYYISKLADGNVWMTQNLDLDLNASTLPLTSDTSDVSSSWNPGSTYYTKTTISSSSTSTDMYSWNLGDYAYDGTTNSSCGTDATSYADCTGFSATSPTTSAANQRHVGNLYQWNTATAGTGNAITNAEAADSICPKGWRLPTSTSSGEFKALVTAYSAGSSVQTLLNSPLYFVRGGVVASGTLRYAGDYGYYWSSTANSSTSYAYYLYLYFYDSSGVSPSNYGRRYNGQSVRCVVGS